MTGPIRIAIVGMGKIARNQHLPAISKSSSFELVATVSRDRVAVPGTVAFSDIRELAESAVEVDAVSLCTPPQARRAIADFSIEKGWHVFLEKPPGATLAEVVALRDQAATKGISLFASWHSRCANGIEPARAWLSNRDVLSASITWREDVRVWHPGQTWIWDPGGFGVFDPGINALSIATRVLPDPFFVENAQIDMPSNCAAPIAAQVAFRDTKGAPITMDLDFRQEGPQSWDIVVDTDAGRLILSNGGAALSIGDLNSSGAPDDLNGEYPRLYSRFASLIGAGVSDVDLSPMRLVADIFLTARVNTVEEFIE